MQENNLNVLLQRDGYVCGRHVGGCLKPLSEDEANLDHIIPKAFYLANKKNDLRRVYNRNWNLQPTHPECNIKRVFQGFPEFTCDCHRLLIEDDALYLVVGEDRFRLWSPITTPNPNERLTISVARSKPVKRSARAGGDRRLMKMSIVGGNAILLPGVYVGNIEKFNTMASSNPTELNKHKWTI